MCDRFTRHYVAAKLRMDPVNAEILALAAGEPFGRVIDIGCGYGQLGVALLEAGLAQSVLGLEHRTTALSQAIRASAGLAFTVEARDLSYISFLAQADTVMLVDVLYQLAPDAQTNLLAAAIRAAGRVVIRTADPAIATRFRLGQAAKRLFGRVWATSGPYGQSCGPDALSATLRAAGFAVTIISCSRGTPFANVLIVGRRDTGD